MVTVEKVVCKVTHKTSITLHWCSHISLQKQRINQSKWTKLYIATALLQVIIIIVLQSIIASQNQAQEANIETSFINHRPSTIDDGTTSTSATVDIALRRFDRIKWENVAFISFQAWFICMAFDAVSTVVRIRMYLRPFYFLLVWVLKRENRLCIKMQLKLLPWRCWTLFASWSAVWKWWMHDDGYHDSTKITGFQFDLCLFVLLFISKSPWLWYKSYLHWSLYTCHMPLSRNLVGSFTKRLVPTWSCRVSDFIGLYTSIYSSQLTCWNTRNVSHLPILCAGAQDWCLYWIPRLIVLLYSIRYRRFHPMGWLYHSHCHHSHSSSTLFRACNGKIQYRP